MRHRRGIPIHIFELAYTVYRVDCRLQSLNLSTVAVKFCDVIVRAARSGRDCSVTTRAIQIITTTPLKLQSSSSRLGY